MEHTFTFALIGGTLYLVVWAGYRLFRHHEHKRLIDIHQIERLERAHYEGEREDRHWIDCEELIRRAHWDGRYGPLMSALELKNREETRWPIGNALQGLAALVGGLFVATLVWDSALGVHGARYAEDIRANEIGSSIQAVEPHSGNSLDSVFLLSLVLVGSGVAFWSLSKVKIGPYIGGSLILTASLLSGLKILNIEKLVSINEVTGIKIQGEYKREIGQDQRRPVYTVTIPLPPFPTASTTPTPLMLCALRKIGAELPQADGIFSVNILAGADKRELKSKTKMQFSSNWALAQQRGAVVQRVVAPHLPTGAALLVSNSGPQNTGIDADAGLLEIDRAPTLQLTGFGVPLEAIARFQKVSWTTECN